VIVRPTCVLPGWPPATRWYTSSEVEAYRRAAVVSGFRSNDKRSCEFTTAVKEERQRRVGPEATGKGAGNEGHAWFVGDGDIDLPRRQPRTGPRRWDDIQASSESPGYEDRKHPPTRRRSLCPTCGRELLWEMCNIRGARADLNMFATCEVHGIVIPPDEHDDDGIRWLQNGPATTAEALWEATRTWQRQPTESEHYGHRS
jgi:hypothetical protein